MHIPGIANNTHTCMYYFDLMPIAILVLFGYGVKPEPTDQNHSNTFLHSVIT